MLVFVFEVQYGFHFSLSLSPLSPPPSTAMSGNFGNIQWNVALRANFSAGHGGPVPIIPAVRRLRQNWEFKASLNFIYKDSVFKTKTKKKRKGGRKLIFQQARFWIPWLEIEPIQIVFMELFRVKDNWNRHIQPVTLLAIFYTQMFSFTI
jgi:hypothetical protein